jgi:4-hydroxy-4-methyl-2-oxoglutarate aldolase
MLLSRYGRQVGCGIKVFVDPTKKIIEVRSNMDSQQVLAIAERFKRLYTGLIYDVLDEMGISNSALASDIMPLQDDMVLAGPAFTIRGHTTHIKDEEVHDRRLELMRKMSLGCIQIRDTGKDLACSHFGEISATAAYAAGCRGAVIDGGVRDSKHLIKMGFPTFCRFRNPVEAYGRWMAFEYQIPIVVRGALADVLVNPGDWLVGDADGVVVIPQTAVREVLEKAEEAFVAEGKSRKAMADGRDPLEVYREYGKF